MLRPAAPCAQASIGLCPTGSQSPVHSLSTPCPVSVDASLSSLSLAEEALLPLAPPALLFCITSTPPFLFALSLFLPSWRLFVPSPSPSLPVIIFFLVRPPEFTHRLVLSPRCTNRDSKKKKRRKGEAFGREGSPPKLIFNPCILFCAHISYISSPPPASSRPDRFSPPPQAFAHLNFPIGETLFNTTEKTTSSTSSFGRLDHQIQLAVLARLRGARSPVRFFDSWASRQAQSTTRASCRSSQLHPSRHHARWVGPRLATALSIEAATLSGSILFLSWTSVCSFAKTSLQEPDRT